MITIFCTEENGFNLSLRKQMKKKKKSEKLVSTGRTYKNITNLNKAKKTDISHEYCLIFIMFCFILTKAVCSVFYNTEVKNA